MFSIAPCKDCTRRSVTCHADCTDYTGWKAQRKAHYEPYRQYSLIVSEYGYDVSERIRKKDFMHRKERR